MTPYYVNEHVQLYLGDCREVLPTLGQTFDAAVCDPPYGATSLSWGRWPSGWTGAVAAVTDSLWCFGSLRVFMDHATDFTGSGWKLSHDVVWRKNTGSGFGVSDRFRCMHELAAHWYRGPWSGVRHEAPRVLSLVPDKGRAFSPVTTPHRSSGIVPRGWEDNGTRMPGSVIEAPTMRGRAIHPTEKPRAVLAPLIEYAVPPGGTLLDPMAGSCSSAVAAMLTGRRAVCIEGDEAMCEKAARRLDQGVLPMGDTGADR